MMEARIECVCAHYDINDLGLSLTRGEIAWVPKAKASQSSELKLAERVGAVSVRWEQRCEVSKDRIPPYMRRRGQAPPVKKPIRQETAPVVDMEQVAAVARQAAAEAAHQAATEAAARVRQDVVSEVRKALDERGNATGGLTREDVASALQDVLGGLQLGTAAPMVAGPARTVAPEVVEADEPVFIPSKIGDDKAKAEITVEGTEATSTSSFDEAAAALKAAAPPRKKRRRKKAAPKGE